MREIVPVAYWILFPIGGLAVAACLIGVFWKNIQMTDARWCLDDGAEEGQGREVYELYRASGRLASFAWSAVVALAALALMGAFGGDGVKIVALVFSGALVLGADHVRARHARLESGFERSVGESLGNFCRRIGEDAVRA